MRSVRPPTQRPWAFSQVAMDMLGRLCPCVRRSKGLCASEIYSPIKADEKPWQRQWLNNLLCMWLHVNRVLEQPGVAKCATSSEKAYLATSRDMHPRVVRAASLMGYVAWRRSTSFLLVVLSSLLICFGFPFRLFLEGWPRVPKLDESYSDWRARKVVWRSCQDVDSYFDSMLGDAVGGHLGREEGIEYRSGANTTCEELSAGPESNCISDVSALLLAEVVSEQSVSKFCGAHFPSCVCAAPLYLVCPVACGTGGPNGTCESTAEFCKYVGIADYIVHWWLQVSEAVPAQIRRVNLAYRMFSFPVNLLMLAAVVQAANAWSSWRRSSWFIFAANLLAIVSPFVFGLLPLYCFVSEAALRGATDALEESMLSLYRQAQVGTEERGSLRRVCSLTLPGLRHNWQQHRGDTGALCEPSGSGQAPAASCDSLGGASSAITSSIEQMYEMCITLGQAAGGVNASLPGDPMVDSGDIMALLRLLSGIGMVASSIARLWPSAFSLSPALISGSFMAKVLVPQASLPGTFVIMLPVLHVPTTWCLITASLEIVWSAFGKLTLLLSLSLGLFCFEPLSKTAIGYYFRLNAPMEQERALWIIGRKRWVSRVIFLMALAMLLIFFVLARDDLDKKFKGSSHLENVIRESVTPVGFVLFLVNFTVRYLLIQVSSLDCMVSIAANERQFETMKKRQEALDNLQFCGNLKRLQYYRNKNLDLLVDLVGLDGIDDAAPGPERFRDLQPRGPLVGEQARMDTGEEDDVRIAMPECSPRRGVTGEFREEAPGKVGRGKRGRRAQSAPSLRDGTGARRKQAKQGTASRGTPCSLIGRTAGSSSAPFNLAPIGENPPMHGGRAGERRERRRQARQDEKITLPIEGGRGQCAPRPTE